MALFFERFITAICSEDCTAVISVQGEEVNIYDLTLPLPDTAIKAITGVQAEGYDKEVIKAIKDNLDRTTVIAVANKRIIVYAVDKG